MDNFILKAFLRLVTFVFAFSLASAHAALEIDSSATAAQVAELDESGDETVDFEINILDPDQAKAFMIENGLTEEQMEEFQYRAYIEQQLMTEGYPDEANTDPKRSGVRAQKRNCVAGDGIASWYGPGFHGKTQACGGKFNQNALTAAHKTIKCGSKVRVTYQGRSVVVTITDAGPYIKGRVIDLSKAAAEQLGLSLGQVHLEILSCGK